MKKTPALLVVLFIISIPVLAQEAAIKGTVIDTSEKRNLSNTVIALLRPADSVLVNFTRSNKDGHFTLQKLPPGKFIVMVTRPAYADFFDQVEVSPGATVDLGTVAMILKSQLLQEVVVKHSRGAIRIKGDTTEYMADSFKVAAGATVEDLLKKLPGIQVDKDGKITAQGETVQKVLVDGEEFFSDDPTIATRGLTADAVQKVQTFDKKSDQAEFTGIDDGQKTKTINLQLKEDRKKGYFGKVETGTDFNKYWNNCLMFNAFKGKRKLSAFGIMSNTGKTGLDWEEGANYGGNNVEVGSSDGGGVSISLEGGDDEFGDGNYWGDGLPKGWSGGLHYSNKWNEDKTHFNGGYQFNKLNTEAEVNTFTRYILPDSVKGIYMNDFGSSFRSRDRNRFNAMYEIKIDSLSSLKITAQGSKGTFYSKSNFHQESLNDDGDTLSVVDRRTEVDGDKSNFNSSLLWKQKFKKQGRTLSLSARQNYTENSSRGTYFSDNNYYKNGLPDSSKVLDQQKLLDNKTSVINSRISYTEPLNKRSLLEFNYSIDNNHRQSAISTLEKAAPWEKEYHAQIDTLSNDYSFNVLTQSGGINYRYAKPKKLNFSFGMNVSNAAYTRKDLLGDSSINYSFTNFFPQANVNWTLPGNGNLRFNYNGNTQAPNIDQIQPIQDITDQLNVRVGNPELKQAFRHNLQLRYNSYKFLSERNIYASFYFTATQNDFSSMTLLNLATGKRTIMPVNVNGNYRTSGYLEYGRRLKKLGIYLGIGTQFSYNHSTNFIGELINENNSYSYGGGPNISWRKDKKFEFWMNTRFSQNISNTSLSNMVTKYWSMDHGVEMLVYLPWKLEIGNWANFLIRQKTSVFDKNNNSIRWNARIDRKLFKNDVARLRFQVNDILNQNIGFNRNINSNFITERTNNTIKRNFMLTFIYNFSKNGKPVSW